MSIGRSLSGRRLFPFGAAKCSFGGVDDLDGEGDEPLVHDDESDDE